MCLQDICSSQSCRPCVRRAIRCGVQASRSADRMTECLPARSFRKTIAAPVKTYAWISPFLNSYLLLGSFTTRPTRTSGSWCGDPGPVPALGGSTSRRRASWKGLSAMGVSPWRAGTASSSSHQLLVRAPRAASGDQGIPYGQIGEAAEIPVGGPELLDAVKAAERRDPGIVRVGASCARGGNRIA